MFLEFRRGSHLLVGEWLASFEAERKHLEISSSERRQHTYF